MHRRQILVLSMVVLASVLVFGSGGYSSATADRGLDVTVVDDADAYLGITVREPEGYVGGEPVTVLELVDRFPGDATLKSVTVGRPFLSTATGTPVDVGGESDPLAVRAECEATGSGTVPVTVHVAGASVAATVDRAPTVTCVDPEIQRVEFDGCGGARIEADDAIYPLAVTKVVANPSTDGTQRTTVTLRGDGRVSGSPGGKLVAVEADGDRYGNDNRCQAGGTASAPS